MKGTNQLKVFINFPKSGYNDIKKRPGIKNPAKNKNKLNQTLWTNNYPFPCTEGYSVETREICSLCEKWREGKTCMYTASTLNFFTSDAVHSTAYTIFFKRDRKGGHKRACLLYKIPLLWCRQLYAQLHVKLLSQDFTARC